MSDNGLDSSAPHAIDAEWYRHGFGELYPVAYAHRSVEAAGPEVAFAAEQLNLQSGQRVLDLGCGHGRHLVHLAARGTKCVGLDYSAALLAHARETLAGAALLVRGDMRMPPFFKAFDAVVNFFTSFGYFLDPEENLAVVRGVANSLVSPGRFFIDYLHADHVAAHLVAQSTRASQGYEIREQRWIDPAACRVNKITTVTSHGKAVDEWSESVRLYSRDQFCELLRQGGLTVDQLFGDYSGGPLNAASSRMIAVGHRA